MALLNATTVSGDITGTGRLILNNNTAQLVSNYIIAVGNGNTANTNAFAVDASGTVYLNSIKSINNTTIQSATGAPFAVQGMSVAPSATIALTNSMAAITCDSVYDYTNSVVTTPILSNENGGIRVSRAGKYFVIGSVYASGVTAGDAIQVAIYKNGTAYASNYHNLGGTFGGTLVHPRIMTCAAGDLLQIYARNYTAARGSLTSTTRTLLTVLALA